jgi:hypothetical protein
MNLNERANLGTPSPGPVKLGAKGTYPLEAT